jgi:hypothetical protein
LSGILERIEKRKGGMDENSKKKVKKKGGRYGGYI